MDKDVPEIVVRVLQGIQTEDDMHVFLQWYHASQENKDIFFQLKHIYDFRKGGKYPDIIELETSWERLWEELKKHPQHIFHHQKRTGTSVIAASYGMQE